MKKGLKEIFAPVAEKLGIRGNFISEEEKTLFAQPSSSSMTTMLIGRVNIADHMTHDDFFYRNTVQEKKHEGQ